MSWKWAMEVGSDVKFILASVCLYKIKVFCVSLSKWITSIWISIFWECSAKKFFFYHWWGLIWWGGTLSLGAELPNIRENTEVVTNSLCQDGSSKRNRNGSREGDTIVGTFSNAWRDGFWWPCPRDPRNAYHIFELGSKIVFTKFNIY